VLHLLYARFWHKVLYDAGVVSTPEPFRKLVHQGMILGELEYSLYRDEQGAPVSAEHVRNGQDTRSARAVTASRIADDEVEKRGDHFVLRKQPEFRVDARAHKMSKSRGNVVNPDEIVAAYGADAFRLYEMFMGPLEQVKPWSTRGVEGTHRFLNRTWRLLTGDSADGRLWGDAPAAPEQLRLLHRTIAKVTDDIEGLRFNTAIAALMEFTNAAYKWQELPKSVAEPFVLLLAPFAPHIAEELWQRLGHTESLAYVSWPTADPEYLRAESAEIAIQVDGKVRAKITVPLDAREDEVLALAQSEDAVARHLGDKAIARAIYVPGRILNLVTRH
jgi:leucyl-tRNA synthetase